MIHKELVRDLLPAVSPFEKVEDLALGPNGSLWTAVDNGGAHEPRLMRLAPAT